MSSPLRQELGELWRLAHRCGVKPAFIGAAIPSSVEVDRRRRASPEAIMAVLRSLGVSIDRPQEASEARRSIEADQQQRIIEPIIVNWQGETASTTLQLYHAQFTEPIECSLRCEDGTERAWTIAPDQLDPVRATTLDGERYRTVRMALPADLPVGYHRLRITVRGRTHEARLFAAPPRTMPMHDDLAWGAFIPLYSIRTERGIGVGDLGDLQHLLTWTQERGGSILGTLPLLASFLDHPCDPSPYTPVSRLFFNELYLDVEAIAGELPAVGMESIDVNMAGTLRGEDYVDFARVMAAKRRPLERLAVACFGDTARRAPIDAESADDPYLGEYSRFRAVFERRKDSWHNWPDELQQRIRDDALRDADADPNAIAYHLFAQHHLRRQLGRIAETDRTPGRGLYLDLPVGVHTNGYDAWRFTECFASGASCGAPPDELFIGGQNWGFAPLHPERSREHGHIWFIEAIRRHLQFAGLLRIDHVMWLHRMYWVPEGFPATDGVYVRNPSPQEFYAILSIESHCHRAAIAGENLGTVPDVVNRTLRRRGMYALSVGQFMLTADETRPLPNPPSNAVASLNTHDTPTFAGYWNETDIDQRIETGLLTESAAQEQRKQRAAVREAILNHVRRDDPAIDSERPDVIAARLLETLGGTDAAVVLATLEDLWGEPRPQNVPGTTSRGNWSRRSAMTIETMLTHPDVLDGVARLDRARRMRDSPESS